MKNYFNFKMNFFTACIAFFLIIQCSYASDLTKYTGKKAICDLHESQKISFIGRVEFDEISIDGIKACKITGNITVNLPDGLKGFHIHQFGNLAPEKGVDCATAGSHFNPENMLHGSPLDHINRHVGDMGNIHVSNKQAFVKIIDSRLSFDQDDKNYIIGRSIVLHELEDDLGRGNAEDSKTTGAAGKRIACCVITLAN